MLKVSDIYKLIDKFAPFNTQHGFDNAGLLVGSMDDEVCSVAIALDATCDTIKQAHESNCNLLVTHHPIIFGGLKSVSPDDAVFQAVKHGITVISVHTNLDSAVGGVNDCLCELLGLQNVKPLAGENDIVPLARVGTIFDKNMTAESFAEYVKGCINCGCVKMTAANGGIIEKVAVCGGAGGEYIQSAKDIGVTAFVTGECKHHERLMAKHLGITLLECGHFSTEQIVKSKIKELLLAVTSDVVVLDESDPAIYI